VNKSFPSETNDFEIWINTLAWSSSSRWNTTP
jgi:hypothetical protein